jgi:hypothetical protein
MSYAMAPVNGCHGISPGETISRAAQMNVWHKFMNFKLSDHPSSAGVASKLCDLASKWKTLKVAMDKETFLGFILQASLDQNTAMTHNFERRVEVAVQDHPENLAPNFNKLVHLVELCRQQDNFAKNKRALPRESSSSPVLQASIEQTADLPPFDQAAFLADIPQEQWQEALHFYAVTANQCFGCGKDTHYLWDHPERARGTPVNKRSRGPGTLSWRNFQQPPPPAPGQFYPFVGVMYPPPGIPYPQHPQYPGFQPPQQYQYQSQAPELLHPLQAISDPQTTTVHHSKLNPKTLEATDWPTNKEDLQQRGV